MAYQFADGFDNMGNAFTFVAGYPWDTIGGTAATTSTADFRFSPPSPTPGACAVIPTASYLRKNLSASQSTIITGFGVKVVALPGSGNLDLVSWWDTATIQLTLAVASTGALQFFRGSGFGTPIGVASNTGVIVANQWYGFSISTTFSATVGVTQLFINGSVVATINGSSLNTISTANANANQVSIGSANLVTNSNIKYDDFYCFDTSGGFLNALPGGDARILTKLPASAGNYTNWTPTGLASNWQNAAVAPPSTADFNANNVSTTKDSYTMQTTGLTSPPLFVMTRASLERDDAGPHTPSLFVRSAAVDATGVVTPAIGSSYQFFDAVFQNDPNTGSAWTGPNADAAQAGVIEG